MRIGIDARKLRDGGIGTYLRGLLGAFAASPGGDEFVAFVAPPDRGALPAGIREVEVRAKNYSVEEHLAVANAAKRAGVDVLHAPHFTLPLAWPGPAVVTIHDLIHVRHPRFFRPGVGMAARFLAGASARRARCVLTGSSHSREEIASLLGVSAAKIRVTPYGVSRGIGRRDEAAARAFREARRLPEGYLLYVGARKTHKNVPLLFRAMAGLRDRTVPLALSGEAWAAGDPLARAAADAGVADRVHFAGPLRDDDELSLLYSGARVYAQPSWDEGFGLPPLEAMACGVPVISSPAGALRETVGDAAVLAPPNDPEAWARAMEEILGDPASAAARVRAGLERARSFTWERTAVLTREAYAEAVRGASPAGAAR